MGNTVKFNVKACAQQLQSQLVEWRRHFHQHPELSFEEWETSKYIQTILKQYDVEVIPNIAKTGLKVIKRGKRPGPTLAIRADMDALPIMDEKDAPYKSTVPGVAHLCGHDAHMTILLGAIAVLDQYELEEGNIVYIFQPAEEGYAGAKHMVEEGVLKNPDVDTIIGLHVHPTAPVGKTTVTPEFATACTDAFDLEIIGRGGHAAHPHQAVDSIAITGEIITSLQQVVSRVVDPLSPIVITIGKIEGGYTRNIIAPSVKLEGTVRLLNPELRPIVKETIERYVHGITSGMGATYVFDYKEGYPSVYNAPSLIEPLQKATDVILGEGSLAIVKPSMGGEDFSYFAEQVPGIFFRLGIQNDEKGIKYPNHHPKFDIDEDALHLGVAIFAQYAIQYFEGE